MQIIKNMPFFNVAANSIATLDLPLGMTYERIIFELGGGAFTKAHITELKLIVNNKVCVQSSATLLNTMNVYRGLATDATHFVLDFSELKARDEVGQSIGALGTAEGVTKLGLQITIGAATTPTLESWSILSGPKKAGVVSKLLSYSQNFAAAGRFPFVLPFGVNGGSVIKRVHFMHSIITAVEVKKNGLVIHDTTNAINQYVQTENGKTIAATDYCIDFIVDNNMSGMLLTTDAKSMEWNLTVSGAGTVTAQVEYIDPLGNL